MLWRQNVSWEHRPAARNVFHQDHLVDVLTVRVTLISLYTTVNRAKQAAGVTEIMTISLFNMFYCVQYNLFYPAFVDPDIETIRVSRVFPWNLPYILEVIERLITLWLFFTIKYIIHIVFVLLNLLFGILGSFTVPVCSHSVSSENENLLYCRCRPCV